MPNPFKFFSSFFKRKVNEAQQTIKDIVKSIVLSVISQRGTGGRDNFIASEIDFKEIDAAYYTDSYVRQAIDKYSELMFKAGWTFKSKNQKALDYIKQRIRYIGYSTGIPFDQLLIEVAEDFIKYSNAFLVKARIKNKQKNIKINVSPIEKGKQPIGGYFRLNPSTMSVEIDEYGNILKWKQTFEDKEVEFDPDDVIHFYYKKEAGKVFGIPYIYPALEDVRLLRQLEDNTASLIYRFAIPIYQFIVGIAQPGLEATQEEIDQVRNEINNLPKDGILITNERIQVKAIGADGNAIDVSDYLEYFENRVFTGLGVSNTQMGRGSTSNRDTATSMDQQMIDRVKAYQRIFESVVNNKIIFELLLEGGFDPINNPDDIVEFKFNEINIDTQIKLENHKVSLFQNNAITYDELREELGRDAIDITRTFTYIFKQLEPSKEVTTKDQPENQHGKKLSPTINPRKEFFEKKSQNSIKNAYYTFMNDIKGIDDKNAEIIINSAGNIIGSIILNNCIDMIKKAKNDIKKSYNQDVIFDNNVVLSIIDNEVKSSIKSTLKDIYEKSKNNDIEAVFNANEYRLDFSANYWTHKAYNIALINCFKYLGYKEYNVYGADSNDEICFKKNDNYSLYQNNLDNIPPFHPGCNCKIKPWGDKK